MLVINGYGAWAVADLWDVVNDRARVQGDTHSDTLETLKYFHLARTQAEPGDGRELDDAIAGLEQILAVQTSRHGPRYPMCRDTAARLSALRKRREASDYTRLQTANSQAPFRASHIGSQRRRHTAYPGSS